MPLVQVFNDTVRGVQQVAFPPLSLHGNLSVHIKMRVDPPPPLPRLTAGDCYLAPGRIGAGSKYDFPSVVLCKSASTFSPYLPYSPTQTLELPDSSQHS